MSNEIQGFNLTPQTLEEAQQYAKLLAESDMVPQDYKGKPGNILVAVQMGSEVGLQPLQALQNIAVINGRPAIWGDALIALVRSHPVCEDIQEKVHTNNDGTPTYAECWVKRRGQDWQSRTFSVQDAQLAGLWNKQGPWKSYPSRMLQMRARAFALRDIFGDVLKGLSVAEEAQDIPQEREVTPERPASPESTVASLNQQIQGGDQGGSQETEAAPALEGPSMDDILARINQATTEDELNAIVPEAEQLPEGEKKAVRNAYGFRRNELRQSEAAGAFEG